MDLLHLRKKNIITCLNILLDIYIYIFFRFYRRNLELKRIVLGNKIINIVAGIYVNNIVASDKKLPNTSYSGKCKFCRRISQILYRKRFLVFSTQTQPLSGGKSCSKTLTFLINWRIHQHNNILK